MLRERYAENGLTLPRNLLAAPRRKRSAMNDTPSGIAVTRAESGQKLLQWLRRRLDVPQGQLHKWIRTGQIRVNGGRVKAFVPVQEGDIIRLPPFCRDLTGTNSRPAPSARPLPPIIARDPDVLVLNKPAGLPTQSGSGHDDSVAARLAAQEPGAAFHPAPVHRLDRDTSGVLLVGRTFAALRALGEALRDHAAVKEYIAWVHGRWPWADIRLLRHALRKEGPAGHEKMQAHPWRTPPPGSREALLLARPLQTGDQSSLLHIRLLTGRTHQIRVQMQATGFPLIGDGKYGSPARGQRLLLHAVRLVLPDGRAFACLPDWPSPWSPPALPSPFPPCPQPLHMSPAEPPQAALRS